jgi:hypothetical protein
MAKSLRESFRVVRGQQFFLGLSNWITAYATMTKPNKSASP